MVIRSLVAAAAIFALASPAISQDVPVDQTIVLESPTTLDATLTNTAFAPGVTAIFVGTVLVALVTVSGGKTVIDTSVGTK